MIASVMTHKPVYTVKKIATPGCIDAVWNKKPWSDVEPICIDQWMKIESPLFTPKTQAKIAYTSDSLYLIFHVEDCYIKAEKTNYQDMVSRESCVEFFFCPDNDASIGFFNFELNCGGTFMLRHQQALLTDVTPVSWTDASKIVVASSLPKVVSPEIATPLDWTLEIKLPFEVLSNYCRMRRPEKSVRWLANLIKTSQGDTSNIHYFTWSKIPSDAPMQMFGQPAYFGTLLFGD